MEAYSLVGTVTRLRAGRPTRRSSLPAADKFLSRPTRTDRLPTQFPIQKVLGVFPTGTELPGSEADHSPPSSAEVKKGWSYTSTVLIHRHGVNKHNFKLNFKTLKKM